MRWWRFKRLLLAQELLWHSLQNIFYQKNKSRAGYA